MNKDKLKMDGSTNLAYTGSSDFGIYRKTNGSHIVIPKTIQTEKIDLDFITKSQDKEPVEQPQRDKWGSDIEFLMSCIAMSVGLGNVWRFPFTALDNGGGAFVIPYLIVLLLVGKPIYYLEMLLGQFASRSCVKIYDLSPAMRGIGYGQVMFTGMVSTYYSSLMAIAILYFLVSFQEILPWSYCRSEWGPSCIDSTQHHFNNDSKQLSSSAELYFYKEVLKEKNTIHDGIGLPDWKLVLCLTFTWMTICLIVIKGVRSSGKMSYFFALFPYLILGILFIRAVTLPGASNGILYFLKPQWDQLLNPKVWYAAVTQVFFSLAVCGGGIIMYASFNRFSQNVYRDAMIVTTLDTATSLLAGVIIFGILGNLAYETGTDDIKSVVQGGSGLAFVSYPEAISKFQFMPQVFSVMFFFMLVVLGIGCNIAMASCLITVLRDRFTKLVHWKVVLFIGVIQFCIGLLYLTPGGQYILNFVDFFGASFVAFVMAIAELITLGWIYGVNRICKDVEFMLGIKTGKFWRICWGIVTPGLMITILVYHLAILEKLTYRDYVYPDVVYTIGWCISAFGILQLPIWALYAIYKHKGGSLIEKITGAFEPLPGWGPSDPVLNEKYQQFLIDNQSQQNSQYGIWKRIKTNLFG